MGGTVSWRHLTYYSAYDVTLDIYQIINNKTILKTHTQIWTIIMGNVDTKLNFRKAVVQLTSKSEVSQIKLCVYF